MSETREHAKWCTSKQEHQFGQQPTCNCDADRKVGLKLDDGKLKYGLIDELAHREFVAVLTFGGTKYPPNNWRRVEGAKERYYDALQRHLAEWRQGRSFDSESGLFTLAHAMCCLHFLLAKDLEAHKIDLGRTGDGMKDEFEGRFAHALKVARERR